MALESVLMQAVRSASEAARSTKAKVCTTLPSRSCLVLISTLDTAPNLAWDTKVKVYSQLILIYRRYGT